MERFQLSTSKVGPTIDKRLNSRCFALGNIVNCRIDPPPLRPSGSESGTEADRLRAAHRAGCALPVKVLDLAEFDLHLDLVPVNGLASNWTWTRCSWAT